MLKCGYLEDFKHSSVTLSGVPQGGIIRPFLTNVYLHEFDVYMKGLQEDSTYRVIRYVRYADDFIIGVVSTYKGAQEIRGKVRDFLRKVLKFSIDSSKSFIISGSKGRVVFLGVDISIPWYKEPRYARYTRFSHGKLIYIRGKSAQGMVKLKAPMVRIISCLRSGGYCDRKGNPLPRFQFYSMGHNDIIKMYNSVLRGILNYYSFVDNFRILAHGVQYILMRSCAKLLAAKLRLGTTAAVYKKFGKNLNLPGKGQVLFAYKSSYLANRMRFKREVSDVLIHSYPKTN